LNLLRNQVYFIDLDKNILFQAIDSESKYYEGAIQYFSALTNTTIESIVTRNPIDFKYADVPVITLHRGAANAFSNEDGDLLFFIVGNSIFDGDGIYFTRIYTYLF
jgi:hypothetical protein